MDAKDAYLRLSKLAETYSSHSQPWESQPQKIKSPPGLGGVVATQPQSQKHLAVNGGYRCSLGQTLSLKTGLEIRNTQCGIWDQLTWLSSGSVHLQTSCKFPCLCSPEGSS